MIPSVLSKKKKVIPSVLEISQSFEKKKQTSENIFDAFLPLPLHM